VVVREKEVMLLRQSMRAKVELSTQNPNEEVAQFLLTKV
jgi:hypothetical protein